MTTEVLGESGEQSSSVSNHSSYFSIFTLIDLLRFAILRNWSLLLLPSFTSPIQSLLLKVCFERSGRIQYLNTINPIEKI